MYAIMNICREKGHTVADAFVLEGDLEKVLHATMSRFLDRGEVDAGEDRYGLYDADLREAMKAELTKLADNMKANGLRGGMTFDMDFASTYSSVCPEDTQGLGQTGFHTFYYYK